MLDKVLEESLIDSIKFFIQGIGDLCNNRYNWDGDANRSYIWRLTPFFRYGKIV